VEADRAHFSDDGMKQLETTAMGFRRSKPHTEHTKVVLNHIGEGYYCIDLVQGKDYGMIPDPENVRMR